MRSIIVATLLTVWVGLCAAQDQTQPLTPLTGSAASAASVDERRSVAGNDKSKPNAAATPVCRTKDLALVRDAAQNSEEVRFNGTFQIKVTGECLRLMRERRERTGLTKVVTLYLDGVAINGLPIFLSENGNGEGVLAATLMRDSENPDNRASWHGILSKRRTDLPMKLPVSLSVGTDLPVDLPSGDDLLVNTVRGGGFAVTVALFLGVVSLLGAFHHLRKGDALRDVPGGVYSLGRSQMAFWGLLVLLCFVGVWALTGGMERIPQQTLILLGISGGTGLAAVLIGQGKDDPAARLIGLVAEEAALNAKVAAGIATPGEAARLATVSAEVRALSAYALLTHTTWRDFFRDICYDGSGISFPRVQVVLWTLCLGVIFVWTVSQVISMPEFPETLLLLLGISNGTYLGFKFPEKT